MYMQPTYVSHICTSMQQDFWINVLLNILGYVPGIIHAVYIIIRH